MSGGSVANRIFRLFFLLNSWIVLSCTQHHNRESVALPGRSSDQGLHWWRSSGLDVGTDDSDGSKRWTFKLARETSKAELSCEWTDLVGGRWMCGSMRWCLIVAGFYVWVLQLPNVGVVGCLWACVVGSGSFQKGTWLWGGQEGCQMYGLVCWCCWLRSGVQWAFRSI